MPPILARGLIGWKLTPPNVTVGLGRNVAILERFWGVVADGGGEVTDGDAVTGIDDDILLLLTLLNVTRGLGIIVVAGTVRLVCS